MIVLVLESCFVLSTVTKRTSADFCLTCVWERLYVYHFFFQVNKKLVEIVKKKNKGGVEVKAHQVSIL